MSRAPRKPAAPASGELVACVGGHRDGQWFWADSWQRELACARRTLDVLREIGHPDPAGHPGTRALRYRDAGRTVEHPTPFLFGPGRVWEWVRRPADE